MLVSHQKILAVPGIIPLLSVALLARHMVPEKRRQALRATILSSQIYAAMPKRPLEAVYCEIKPALSGSLFLTQQAMPLES